LVGSARIGVTCPKMKTAASITEVSLREPLAVFIFAAIFALYIRYQEKKGKR